MCDHELSKQRQMLGQLLGEAAGELGASVLEPHVQPVALGKGEEQQVILAIHRLERQWGPQREWPDWPRPGDGDVR